MNRVNSSLHLDGICQVTPERLAQTQELAEARLMIKVLRENKFVSIAVSRCFDRDEDLKSPVSARQTPLNATERTLGSWLAVPKVVRALVDTQKVVRGVGVCQ